MSMSSFLTSSTLKRSDLGLNYQTAFYDAISAAHALSFIRSHQLKRRAGRTCWTRRLPRSNLLPKPNSEMITPTLAVEANFRLNSVAHVRRNCQTTTADHPLGLRELCKTKQERNSRRGTEFHPQGDGRRKRFRRPQGVNLSIFWQLTRGLRLVRIIFLKKSTQQMPLVSTETGIFNFKNVHSTLWRDVYDDHRMRHMNINPGSRFWGEVSGL